MENSILSASGPVQSCNPWGCLNTAPSCSLMTVMDEELAKEISGNDGTSMVNTPSVTSLEVPFETTIEEASSDETDNDLMLAQLLQLQFDEEYEKMIKAREDKMNGTSKVSICFDNYRKIPAGYFDDDDEEMSSSDEDIDFIQEKSNKQSGNKPGGRSKKRQQMSGSGKNITTKHDAEICGRKNAQNIEKFPPSFASGDIGSKELDLKISNNVYNTLKQHSIKEAKQSYRLHEKKENSTHEQALDPKTRLLLYKLVNNEILEAINGCISTGKEACVFHAHGGKIDDKPVPHECAVKVFKTTLNEFKTRERYIKDDHRFKDRMSKQNPRKTIKLWAEKEMCNLMRLHRAGIRCPEVVLLKKQVLVMSFIGKDQFPAPKLKNVVLNTTQKAHAYKQCVEMMCMMFKKCNLIHADLSEYNMLWFENNLYFIDVSQSVEPMHPHALEFLYRDCTNVTEFFKKLGVDVINAEELFNKVSELDIPVNSESGEGNFLIQVKNCERFLLESKSNKKKPQDYAFNYMFNSP